MSHNNQAYDIPNVETLIVIKTLHYENTPIQIYRKFHHQKNWEFSDKNSDIFRISA